MAMPPALARYWRNKRSSKSRSTAMVRYRPSHPVRYHRSSPSIRIIMPKKKRSHRRHRGGGGHGGLVPLLVLAAALGYANNVDEFMALVEKVPGAKTYGGAAAVAGVSYAIDRWVYPSKWLKAATAVGLIITIYTLGKKQFELPDWAGDVADADTVASVT